METNRECTRETETWEIRATSYEIEGWEKYGVPGLAIQD